MENILGYCQPGNFDKKVDLPPPPYDAKITQNTEPLELPLSGNLELSENDVYEALLNHVSKFICYGKGVVKEMIIIKMEQFYAYRHSLGTFTENRQVCWSYEPYAGGHIDGPLMKHCYDPWEITVDPLRQFDRHNVKLIMPHTEMLQACPDCGGAGRIECAFCHGKGKMTCNTCNESGYTFGFSGEDRQMCVHCFSGTVTCAHCKGKGIHGCSICSEAGEIKCYVQLIVHWNNYTDSSLIEHSSDIPKDILKKATGELVYDEINDPKMEERIQRFFKLGFINNIDKFYIFHEAPHGWYLQDWKQFILKFNYIQYRIMPWLLFKQDDQYPTPHPLIKVCSALELPYERIKSRFLWVSSAGISPPKFNENGGDNLNLVVILKNLLLTNSKHFVKTATPGIHINEYEFFEKFIAHNESVEDSIMSDITDLPSKEESFYLEEHADENVREAYKARNKRIK